MLQQADNSASRACYFLTKLPIVPLKKPATCFSVLLSTARQFYPLKCIQTNHLFKPIQKTLLVLIGKIKKGFSRVIHSLD